MLPRTLEPEVMDTAEEAADYDAMDHSEVNRRFVDEFLAALPASDRTRSEPLRVLDTGTGTALIPIELCRHGVPAVEVTAIDLAEHMLALARENVSAAGFQDRIHLRKVDSKSLPFDDHAFDAVMSNSIVHHIPRPISVLREMHRVLRPGGLLFVRDLMRPPDEPTVEHLVATYTEGESPRQQQLFRQSLHAALTVEEVQERLAEIGLPTADVTATTDRHWTLSTIRPGAAASGTATGPIEAIVFDLDGLVFNTEHVFHASGRELLRRRGLEMPDDLHRAMMGRRAEEAYPLLVERMQLEEDVERIVSETRDIFYGLLDSLLAPMPGLFDLLGEIETRQLPKGIATSSRRSYLEDVLGRYDLLHRFPMRLTAEDVTHGKPHPEIYERAAERLGVAPGAMLVFEDSEIGTRAAAAAGAVVVSVPHEHSRHMDFTPAHYVAEGLGDPAILDLIDRRPT